MTADISQLDRFLAEYTLLIDRSLEASLEDLPAAGQLLPAMRYSLLNGGKRLRPLLLLATITTTGGNPAQGLAAAAAVEMVHSYSLIHDDLPAMDDDDLRRGQPTCHIVFGEAVAILAGDGLLTRAFEVLAEAKDYDTGQRLRLIQILAKASGALGMVAGQAVDLAAVGQDLELQSLQQMHLLKTGALLEASILMGATCNHIQDPHQLTALRQYARAIGLAFQVQDDIMDVESDTATLGKTQGKDAANNKPTYTSLLGMKAAKNKAKQLHNTAMKALSSANLEHSLLADLATHIVTRKK